MQQQQSFATADSIHTFLSRDAMRGVYFIDQKGFTVFPHDISLPAVHGMGRRGLDGPHDLCTVPKHGQWSG